MSILTPRIEDTHAFVTDEVGSPHWLVVITPPTDEDTVPLIIEVTDGLMNVRHYRRDEEQTQRVRMRLRVKVREHSEEHKTA